MDPTRLLVAEPARSRSRAASPKGDCERGAIDLPQSSRPYKMYGRLVGTLSLTLFLLYVWPILSLHVLHDSGREVIVALDDICPQVDPLIPPRYERLLQSLDQEFASGEFKLKAYELLGGAVRIPTVSFDDLGLPSEDPRWEVHTKFREYLESRFPKVHANLKRTRLNTHALIYEWKGTETTKPLLLTAHMDVVPVDPATYDDWVHPPFSGHYDGTWIWGRGSADDKHGVIGSLIAIETLLERGFMPSRTVILAFGIDEETGGYMGAGVIGQHLLDTYGPDSMSMLIDEGGSWANLNGKVFSMPAVAERGYMDVRMDVLTPGGHSSRPPKHTGIGILADLITELEAHPHEPELIRGRTYYQGLECRAKYDASFPASLKKLLLQSQTSDEKLQELRDRLVDFDPLFYAMSGTTQAFDLVSGGVKVNALPEAVWAVANYRIVDHSSLAQQRDYLINVAIPVATKHNMTLDAFGRIIGSHGPSWGTILLSKAFNELEPAPLTPTTGSGPYHFLSGTIRSTFQTHLRTDGLPTSSVVAPGTFTGNTDTRHYWNLTRHIFRYGHRSPDDMYGDVHTINEAIRAEAFLEQVRFFTRLILNADDSDLLD